MNTVKPESIALFCLTPGGVTLAKRLQGLLPLSCFTSAGLASEGFTPFAGSFARTAQAAFADYSALIFICATGIAVRVIAPLLRDKLRDPAVVVIDERGRHVISLLAGHAGGANALTRFLADALGAEAVITTATDVNDMAALDTLACRLDARMVDFRAAVKRVNQLLVSRRRVGVWWDAPFQAQAAQCDTRGFIPVADLQRLPALDALVCVTLRAVLPELPMPVFKLVPRRVVAGIGCRRGATLATLQSQLRQALAQRQWDPLALRAIGSIDRKQNEAGLKTLAAVSQVDFLLFSADQLRVCERHFPGSDFVQRTVGVGSVSGPVAWLMSGGALAGETLRGRGVTITLGVTD